MHMKKILLNISLVLVALTLLAACKPAVAITLTEQDNGRTIEISKDSTFAVTLQSNPTTGYAWTVAIVDSTVVQQQGDKEYKQGNTDANIVGAGGAETFTFRAMAAGQTTLQLIYSRSWETDIPPIQTFEVTLVVK
jgi:inhibitor of cysteine peptidase